MMISRHTPKVHEKVKFTYVAICATSITLARPFCEEISQSAKNENTEAIVNSIFLITLYIANMALKYAL